MNVLEAEAPTREPAHQKYDRLIARARRLPPAITAIAHPCDKSSLESAIEAAKLGSDRPDPGRTEAKIEQAAADNKLDVSQFEIVDAAHSHDAAAKAVALVRAGKAEALMKGSLHTDELMAAVVAREGGLRTARRISHCFIMDVPGHPDALVITDAAVNIAPTLKDKVDIVQNAIDLAHAMGVDDVRVAILSAMETINPDVPSTLEAAALCKMADRGQITGGLLDGPLALDNAISPEAAAIKKIKSPVAGPRERPGRAGPGGREHARQEPVVPGRGRRGRHRAGRARADHSHEPRRRPSRAACVLRRRRFSLPLPGAGMPPPRFLIGRARCRPLAVINAGSSSIKFALFEEGAEFPILFRGQVEKLGVAPRLTVKDAGRPATRRAALVGRGTRSRSATTLILETAVRLLRRAACESRGPSRSARRHGVCVTRTRRCRCAGRASTGSCPLAPLHQPHNLAAIEAIADAAPHMPQVACFDTAFHRRSPQIAQMFALPREMTSAGSSALRLPRPIVRVHRHAADGACARMTASGRVIVAHLGNGSSLCAMRGRPQRRDDDGFHGGRWADDGHSLRLTRSRGAHLPDGRAGHGRTSTRRPRVPPLWSCRRFGTFVRHAYLTGHRMTAAASVATDLFVYRIIREIGSMVAGAGGIDAIVFTGGIGQNDAATRAEIAAGCNWLGLELDPKLNQAGATKISGAGSKVDAFVIPTDEEQMIARHTSALMMNQAS